MTSSGVLDRHRCDPIGRPDFSRACLNGDVYGAQATVVAAFTYGNREYALNVLIDHRLGGGVKDVILAVGGEVDRLREGMRSAAAEDDIGSFVDEISAEDASRLLTAALTRQPCPEKSDQIVDSQRWFPLVFSRACHMARSCDLPEPFTRCCRSRSGGTRLTVASS